MSALLAHAKACRAISDGFNKANDTIPQKPDSAELKLLLACISLAFGYATASLIDQAKAECSGDDRRGCAGRKGRKR